MAEPKVFINDQNVINQISSEPQLSDDVMNTETDSLTQAQEVMIDQLLSDSNENLENQKDVGKDIYTNSNEEHHVESPTTRESFTLCVFCDRVLNASDDPKLLECLHNSCSSCINSKLYEHNDGMETGQIECPLCGIICDPSRIIDNQFLLELSSNEDTAKSADMKCSSCSDDAVASSYCTDRSEFICDNCVQARLLLLLNFCCFLV